MQILKLSLLSIIQQSAPYCRHNIALFENIELHIKNGAEQTLINRLLNPLAFHSLVVIRISSSFP